MKKVLSVAVIMLLLCSFREPEALKWYSWKEGSELAIEQNKPIFLFVCISWCDRSQRLEKKVFNNKEILPMITGNFIPVKIDVEADTALLKHDKSFNKKLAVSEVSPGKYMIAVPRTVFTDVRGTDMVVMEGLQDPKELKENINNYLKKH
jgi:thioredoxin-related protein